MRYKAALEAMTLYKNEKSTLPLSDTKNKKVALIGPQGTNAGTCAY
jgi:beta-glucosidase-like glycosyl hydrolase